jgi:prepilin-type N-terminal cleavage/methylation domain-containing protein
LHGAIVILSEAKNLIVSGKVRPFATLRVTYRVLIEQAKAMKSDANKTGLSLVEMLVVVAIIVILTTMVIGLAGRIDNQSKERLTKSTIAIITAALGQFQDYRYQYKNLAYADFDFPPDCNGFDVPLIQKTLENVLGLAAGSVLIAPAAAHNDPGYSGGEVMYFFLGRVPESRMTLDKIDESLVTNLGLDNQPMNISITYPDVSITVLPLLRINDPWGTALRYDYYNEMLIPPDPGQKRTFPEITSAGPDKKFGTADDIRNR